MVGSVPLPYRFHVGEPSSDWAAVPARAGVAVFESPDGRTTLIATTADLRELARKRLAITPPDAQPSKATDLRGVTSALHATTVGSAFEADLVYLDLVRRLMPDTHRAITERWQGWFIHVDPAERFPRWTKVCTTALGSDTPAADLAALARSGGLLLGPVRDKHAAGKLMELLDDLFDLCRFHNLLVQAPSATACAYKEMGKCPAPCDSSESLESYRLRVAEAARCASDPGAWAAGIESAMRHAASGLHFEEAARLKRTIEAGAALTRAPCRHLGELSSLAYTVVARSERPGWSRVFVAAATGVLPVADIHAEAPLDAFEELARACAHAAGSLRSLPFDAAHSDTLGLLCRWLYLPARSTIEFIPGATPGPAALRAAAAGVLRPSRVRAKASGAQADTSEVPEQTVEPLETQGP